MCLALASSRSVLEPAGVDYTGHRGSFWQPLKEGLETFVSETTEGVELEVAVLAADDVNNIHCL